MNDQLNLEALILASVGSGISHSLLGNRIAEQVPHVSCRELDAALGELQLSGALHQFYTKAECVWVVGPCEEEVFKDFSPEVIEQILNPGEFVEIDVDQLLAELDAMIARARTK
ncbi:hypothetical protein J3P85_07295 [Pseudomonas sp. Z1-12]|uniref:hypothetical protein n=1 Tax=unclassified Pseudomonas TaxID=196821 RepID=UPI003DA93C3C